MGKVLYLKNAKRQETVREELNRRVRQLADDPEAMKRLVDDVMLGRDRKEKQDEEFNISDYVTVDGGNDTSRPSKEITEDFSGREKGSTKRRFRIHASSMDELRELYRRCKE